MPRCRSLAVLLTCAATLSPATPTVSRGEEQAMSLSSSRLPDEGDFPSLNGAIEWINSPPLTVTQLRGKVVVVEFWTYTCVNWRRTLPYVRAWSDKYKDQGLVVIGVHTPEFEFEKNLDNVRRATGELGIHFPVAVDSKAEIWGTFF